MVQRERIIIGCYDNEEKEILVDLDCDELELVIIASDAPASRTIRIKVGRAKIQIPTEPEYINPEDYICGGS